MKGSVWRALVFASLACAYAVSLKAGDSIAAQQRNRGNQRGHGNGGSCALGSEKGKIQHVIYLIFDNVHFLRDNPNVPSDLEQMPNLLNFIRGNGTLLTNNHTVLISHTGNGILTQEIRRRTRFQIW
jgi:hypothetical protein